MTFITRFFFFWWLRFSCLVLLSLLLSCSRVSNVSQNLDHDFLPGTDEGLYRRGDLIKAFNGAAADKLKKISGMSDKAALKQKEFLDYQDLYTQEDLLQESIRNWDEVLKVRTGPSKGKKAKVLHSQENVFIDSDVSFINEYEFLDYQIIQTRETEQQKNLVRLLGQVKDFKGFPHTDYYILAKDEGNFLILYKVAEPDKIPYDELFMARRVGSLLAVPLVGYPIEYCKTVPVLNVFNEKTSKYRPLCEGISKEQASYIRLKEDEKKVFEYLPKPNLFRRDFFEGQWFYVGDTVRTGRWKGRTDFQPARLVEFHPTPDHLDVLDSSLYNLKHDDKTRALFIPVKWMNYEIQKDLESLNSSFSERLKTGYDINRPYFAIQFDKLVADEPMIANHLGQSERKSLNYVVIAKDYISIDIEIYKGNDPPYLKRHVFRRTSDNWDYRQKQWFEDDSVLFFPASKVKGEYYQDEADHSRADEDRFWRLTRFNPKREIIRWYFSKQSSKEKWIRDLGREAVFLINQAFKEAANSSDQKIKVILDEREAKEVGDIRYNILNLMLTEGDFNVQARQWPNVANPITGEVISATVNVWVNDLLSDYVKTIRQYIRFQVYPPTWKLRPHSQGVTDFFYKKINKLCQGVSGFIKKNRNKKFNINNPDLNDESLIDSCAKKMARVYILQSILHKMLKSFGQEKVLSASSDTENFYKSADEIKKLFGADVMVETSESDLYPHSPQYSSVMDSVENIEHPILSVPGKLDIAALRFIYFDQVELRKKVRSKNPKNTVCLNNGRCFLKVPSGANSNLQHPQTSILEGAGAEGLTKDDIKSYGVCGWDGGREAGEKEPLCQYGDYGATPLEIVQNIITQADNILITRRNRYDSEEMANESFPFIRKMDTFYKKWVDLRDKLLKGQGETLLDYSFLNPDHRKAYLRIIEEEARRNPEFRSYYEIRQTLFKYLHKIAFMPVKHCVYKGLNGSYLALALENIEKEIDYRDYPEDSREEFISCKSPVVQKQAQKHDRGELVSEVGFFGNDRTYLLRPNEKDEMDEKSMFGVAFFMTTSLLHPLLWEPDLGDLYYQSLEKYIFKGVNLNPYIDIQKNPDIPLDEKGKPNLPPVLSSKIDREINKALGTIYQRRGEHMKAYINALQKHQADEELRLLSTHFDYQSISLKDLNDYGDLVQREPKLYEDTSPFLVQAYQDYEKEKIKGTKGISFVKFLREHPATVSQPDNSRLLIPFADELSKTDETDEADEQRNFMAKLFRLFNEYAACVKEHSAESPCESIEDKEAFTEFVLDSY